MGRIITVLLSAALLFTLVACSDSNTSSTQTQEPAFIKDEPVPPGAEDARVVELIFTPQDIEPDHVTVQSGEKILFVITNIDEEGEHNFLSAGAAIPEIMVYGGQTVRRLWTAPETPGVYDAMCTIHPWIKMKFTVE
ncbi:cupredoxin domain-containing protein [Desulfurispirillum indicum]|uniref:EfeO-type cupredoxin-like domain-containing protein n=1 Tax=Desulfurispirillum indicum (strain ATCC BAA-1389 / DSM 22839 / S5) TaxID=653733 RepID=E6W0Z0_DESIS|nr:cupredoxin domain-containing protein [Desulfurispirillum indicum]ADU65322.1 hypothetical protein Selin_0574 [Desulfurispirillum indicum S5]UCZ57218.1 cupredoxin domain-containing protein [Desulfurispirillum indicum]